MTGYLNTEVAKTHHELIIDTIGLVLWGTVPALAGGLLLDVSGVFLLGFAWCAASIVLGLSTVWVVGRVRPSVLDRIAEVGK